jgi:3-dehydro-L-gulonate 2-dehydrogenase
MRIPFNEVQEILKQKLVKHGFNLTDAAQSAKLFAETSLDGVYSHGLNRFLVYIRYIQKKYIVVDAKPEKISYQGSFERWDGRLGPGNLNAWFTMNRAIELAISKGIGIVALRNTNHWMRGGTYGWQAAGAGCMAICFTNTKPNMPPWGGNLPVLGNNPFIVAVPRKEGHLVLDMAMSQFSYGRMEVAAADKSKLPFPGGYDKRGQLTDNPEKIIESERVLPIGYWKGSGMAMMLDLLAAGLAEGAATNDIGKKKEEYGVSQVFMAFNVENISNQRYIQQMTDELINAVHHGSSQNEKIYYPGERTLQIRQENLKLGIPVKEQLWKRIMEL